MTSSSPSPRRTSIWRPVGAWVSSRARAVALEDSITGVTAAAAAGMYVIGVPYFAGSELPGSDLLADSLADSAVLAALGLV